jgi:transglutaminase-like putative cysteine protease
MRVTIVHETVYRYESPAHYSVQYLRLSPRSTGRQKVISWKLEAPAPVRHWVDTFGNDAHLLVVDRPHAEIRVRAKGDVEVLDTPAAEDVGPQSLDVYLRATALTSPDAALTSFARDFRGSIEGDRKEGLLKLMASLRDRIEYKGGVTHAATAASDAFSRGAGVCQDHAHVFLASCRTLGVPARYVSGYLAADRNAQLASHAWVEAWVPDEGWQGYDIANNTRPGVRHVRVAVGLDYLDACPVRGYRRGGRGESMAVDVQVLDGRRARQAQAQQSKPTEKTKLAEQARQSQQQQQQ